MKKIKVIIVATLLTFALTGCTQSERVSANISKEADNFNVTRRFAVINTRLNEPVFEVIGRISVQEKDSGSKVECIIEVEKGEYKKHTFRLSEEVMWMQEDITGAFVNPYHYEINILPEMFMPYKITNND